jgi:threonine synthase
MKTHSKPSTQLTHWPGIIDHYRSYLDIADDVQVVTLHEGNTPLIYSPKLTKLTGIHVWLKFEGAHPTGSFKDRGMTMAVTKAKHSGAKAVLCASTGNTSASAAAYAARAGMRCFVILPAGAVAMGKLSQAIMADARVISIDGNFDDALNLAREATKLRPIALVNSVNPDRIEGQKTGAFEICDQMDGAAPDFHIMPVGNAGNITAYWKGYQDYKRAGKTSTLPKMIGFQAAGAAPIVHNAVVKDPKTIATAIKIGNPASWEFAKQARDESGGMVAAVTDEQILHAYKWIAAEEGVFAEPASAASVAGLLELSKNGYFAGSAGSAKKPTCVCVLTGHGLKDPDTALKSIGAPRPIPATRDHVLAEIDR